MRPACSGRWRTPRARHAETRLELGLALGARRHQRPRALTDLDREHSARRGWIDAFRLAPSAAADPHARVRENVDNEADESCGVARDDDRRPHARVDGRRALACSLERARALLDRRDDGTGRSSLREELTSGRARLPGTSALLPPRQARRVAAATKDGVDPRAGGVVEDGLANWPRAARRLETEGEIRPVVPRAPGIVVGGEYLDEELSCRRGAHVASRRPRDVKGAGICHGTAGNGYALLAAFERTGTSLAHGRDASPSMPSPRSPQRAERGRGRSRCGRATSACLYLAACVDARAAYPVSTLTRLAAVTPPSDALRDALAEFIAIPSVSADVAHAADIDAAAAWIAQRIREGGGTPSSSRGATRPLVIGEIPARQRPESAPTISATRTSTCSRPTRSSSGSRRRSSSPSVTASSSRGASPTTRATCSRSSRPRASWPQRRAPGQRPLRLRRRGGGRRQLDRRVARAGRGTRRRGADPRRRDDRRASSRSSTSACAGCSISTCACARGRRTCTRACSAPRRSTRPRADERSRERRSRRRRVLPDELRVGATPPSEEELAAWAQLPAGSEQLVAYGATPIAPGAGEDFYLRTFATRRST